MLKEVLLHLPHDFHGSLQDQSEKEAFPYWPQSCYMFPKKKALNCQDCEPRKTISGTLLSQGEVVDTKLFCLRFVKLLVHELDHEFDWQPIVSQQC